MFDRIEKEMETFSSKFSGQGPKDELHLVGEAKDDMTELIETGNATGANKHHVEKGSKKKKGKSTGNTKTGAAESGPDNQENVPTRAKKNQRKSKDTGSVQVSDAKSSARKDLDRTKEENLNVPSEDWIMQKILILVSDFEGQGGLLYKWV